MAEKVFLDTCVLFPAVPRRLVLGAARAGLLQPFWSPRVLEEWRIAAARQGGGAAEDGVVAEIAAIRREWPEAEVAPDPARESGIRLRDPADAHVAAAALAAGATSLITFNIRDFPARRLAAVGLAVRHPDSFFWELLSREPDRFGSVVAEAVAACDSEGLGARKLLKKAHLPRLGKAVSNASAS